MRRVGDTVIVFNPRFGRTALKEQNLGRGDIVVMA